MPHFSHPTPTPQRLQCESEFDNKYKEVMKTSQGQGTVHRLEAGKSYRFRVYSVNVDGVAGPKSDSVVVHTMLDTPAAPTLASIGAKSVSLSWKGRAANTSTRDPSAVQKMLSDWAGTHGDNDGGVSIETAFARYDTNGSGDIDAPELAKVLEDLGVEVSEERLSEAFSVLDTNGDGIITFDEFAAWWRREEVVYVLKRSEPIYIARYVFCFSPSNSSFLPLPTHHPHPCHPPEHLSTTRLSIAPQARRAKLLRVPGWQPRGLSLGRRPPRSRGRRKARGDPRGPQRGRLHSRGQ